MTDYNATPTVPYPPMREPDPAPRKPGASVKLWVAAVIGAGALLVGGVVGGAVGAAQGPSQEQYSAVQEDLKEAQEATLTAEDALTESEEALTAAQERGDDCKNTADLFYSALENIVIYGDGNAASDDIQDGESTDCFAE